MRKQRRQSKRLDSQTLEAPEINLNEDQLKQKYAKIIDNELLKKVADQIQNIQDEEEEKQKKKKYLEDLKKKKEQDKIQAEKKEAEQAKKNLKKEKERRLSKI